MDKNIIWICKDYLNNEGEHKIRSVKTTRSFLCDVGIECRNMKCLYRNAKTQDYTILNFPTKFKETYINVEGEGYTHT